MGFFHLFCKASRTLFWVAAEHARPRSHLDGTSLSAITFACPVKSTAGTHFMEDPKYKWAETCWVWRGTEIQVPKHRGTRASQESDCKKWLNHFSQSFPATSRRQASDGENCGQSGSVEQCYKGLKNSPAIGYIRQPHPGVHRELHL